MSTHEQNLNKVTPDDANAPVMLPEHFPGVNGEWKRYEVDYGTANNSAYRYWCEARVLNGSVEMRNFTAEPLKLNASGIQPTAHDVLMLKASNVRGYLIGEVRKGSRIIIQREDGSRRPVTIEEMERD